MERDYPIDPCLTERMAATMIHRGPDDQGYFSNADVQLGNRRLSIIDIEGGHQPISNEDQTIWITFNGEIYNHTELGTELKKRGHRFRTRTDTETIIHLYEEFGIEGLRHLNGMFAFALWDGRTKTLYLVRDRLGIKPLFYTRCSGQLVFSSELKGLLACPCVDRKIERKAIDQYLSFLYVPEPWSIFKGIHKLPPGHYLKVKGEQIRLYKYWDIEPSHEHSTSEDGWERGIIERLKESLRLRLRADVPLGVFLSGGIDSSTVVALVAGSIDGTLKTFSMGFEPFADYDETAYAQLVSRLFNTDHHVMRITPVNLDRLSELVWHLDEPMGDPSALPLFELARYARNQVKVVLVGEGGDELFGGYSRYLWDKLARGFGRMPFRSLVARMVQLLPHRTKGAGNWVRLAKKFTARSLYEPYMRYASWYVVFDQGMKAALYADGFFDGKETEDSLEGFARFFHRFSACDQINTLCMVDIKHYLPGDLLAKADRMTMAHSLEARFPFLDHNLVEYAVRIPGALKIKGTKTKYVLRNALRDLLPPNILRRKKMGFGVPLEHWFRDRTLRFAEELLFEPRSLARGYFYPAAIRRLLEDHKKGLQIYSYHLWALVILELWHRRYVDAC